METTGFSRRTLAAGALGLGVVGVTTLAAMQSAVAQTMEADGSWMDMVKRHHAMIADTFDQILQTRDDDRDRRDALEKRLSYLLTAHSVAEENVLYPAMTRYGMEEGSNHLYMEQAHAKVGNADLVMSRKDSPEWIEHVRALRTAVLHHAKDDEEGNFFPRLMQAAGPEMNARLTRAYAMQFGTVREA